MDPATWTALGAGAGVVIAALAVGAWIGPPLRKLSRQNTEFRVDWYGTAARPGVDREPGVMERLKTIEGELKPNGGGSLRDAVNRLERRLDDHLRAHGLPPT